MIEGSVPDVLVGRAVRELARVSEAKPNLAARCPRASDILERHFADPRAGVIRGQLRGGGLAGYLVRGSGGAVYRVEASGSWRCSCPDHHGRHRRRGDSKACKHGLAVWALWRAGSGASSPEVERVVARVGRGGCAQGRGPRGRGGGSRVMAASRDATDLHHQAPRCLLRLFDLAAEGEIPWSEFDAEAERWEVESVGLSREVLASLIADSTREIPAPEHRRLHQDAGDFVRWGRRGGLRTLARYGRPYFWLLARFRWGRVEVEALVRYREGLR